MRLVRTIKFGVGWYVRTEWQRAVEKRGNKTVYSHRNIFYLFLPVQRYRKCSTPQTTLLATTLHAAQLWEIAWIARTGRYVYRVSDRGQLRVETRWTHSKIDLTPEACSLEAGGEKDWRWETAPTLGRGKPSLARLRRCVSSPRHLARAAGHATRVCCELWYAGAEGCNAHRFSNGGTRAPSPCRHSITARGLSACYDANEISLFHSCPDSISSYSV